MKLFWFLPSHGDSHLLGTSDRACTASYRYLRQIAQAADELGFEGVLRSPTALPRRAAATEGAAS